MSQTPVAIFVYNRPEHTRNMLQSLTACSRLDECYISIYSDAARIPEHAQKVDEVRALIRTWGAERSAHLIEREENWGLARSIVGGVTELCERYGRVIVIEDDLVLHPAFIHYMLSALERYKDDERVAQVSGYMFPVEQAEKPDAFFLPFTTTWGWGIWQRVWKGVDWLATGATIALKDQNMRKKFDLDGTFPYTQMLLDRLNGKNQSWGVLFLWHTFTKGKLTLYPRHTLAINSGMDGSGYHSSAPVSGFNSRNMTFESVLNFNNIQWAMDIDVDVNAYQKVKQHLATLTTPNRFEKIARRISNLFHVLKKRSKI